jgi:hypothetical protein
VSINPGDLDMIKCSFLNNFFLTAVRYLELDHARLGCFFFHEIG